ncbi:MAG: alpha/beta fold hydrolase [Hyphomicrobiaceae bacterium]
MVLLHPVGLDLTFLAPVATVLARYFTVLSVDQRGHGKSQANSPASGLDDYAEDLHALLAELKIVRPALVGFSFGGMVAQAFAIRYPGAISALVPCACPPTLSPEGRVVARARGDDARKDGMSAVLEATLDRWFTPAFRVAGQDQAVRRHLLSHNVEGWAQAWYAIGGIDTLPRLHEVRVPALCIAGELDKSSPPPIVRTIADAIPGALYAELKGAPHMLFMEQPEETARIASGFLQQVLK